MKYLMIPVALLAVSACVQTVALAPAGVYEPDAKFTTQLQEDWSHFPKVLTATQGSLLTKDGLGLNEVHMITIESDQAMVKGRKKDNHPVFRADMSALEQVEFLTSSLAVLGYQNLEAVEVKPETFDSNEGLRINLKGSYPSGLNLSGDVAMVRHDNQLSMVIYLAPTEHYFDSSSAEVAAIMSSMDIS
ncbi:MAG: hypothetical protein AAFX02_11320 [Pseudomonadota bacterium]